MAGSIHYENDFIVGGSPDARVTPNFRLREFHKADGSVFLHRDLAAALQILRNTYGQPLVVAGLAARQGLGADRQGLFVWLKGDDPDALEKAANKLVRDGDLARCERQGDELYVEVAAPAEAPSLKPELALEKAIQITAGFETSGDPYQQVTGNFDGAGLSFGPLQVNFGTGSLPELFARFRHADEGALRRCFGDDYDAWQAVLRLSRKRQVVWADEHSTGTRKQGFAQPWKGYLQAVGREPRFQRETLAYAYDVYGRRLIVALAWLRGLVPIKIDNFRCLSALYDLCVQQGSLDKAHAAIRRRVEREQPQDQFALTRIAVEERGRKARPEYRADCISRRLAILEREPVRVRESGQSAQRSNPMLYLVRNTNVSNVERYLL